MLNFYDFEVFKFDWMVTVINPIEKIQVTIENDLQELKAFYEAHKDQIWIGYNSRSYDQYIMKAILAGFDPWDVNAWIIVKGRKGWEYSSMLNLFPLYNYDCLTGFNSLKQLEGFMGHNMKETQVPFNIDRKLTVEELMETRRYNIHDVEQTMEVFLRKKADFDAHMDLLTTFNLPLKYISKTQAQLSAIVLGCVKKDWCDEWDIQLVDTMRISKYKEVVDWFLNPKNYDYNNKGLTIDVCGVPHQFGWGGIHGAPDKPIHKKGLLIHVDVTSYYPSLMIRYDLLSRNVSDKEKYKQIYNKRVELKKAGKKKEQAPYKIILNATYGIEKDPTSTAYDPRQANNVCINGQLLLLDLLEHLEGHCELIQSNTDGLIIQIEDTDEAFNTVDDICYEWETRTGMSLGFDTITEIWQKDVNNYVFKFENGKIERKGAYVKELSNLDYNLPIVNKAMVDYMVKGIPVEDTINQCEDLKEFQMIFKVSSKYICGWHKGVQLNSKTYRVFASTRWDDTFLGKVKLNKIGIETVERFANTPDHCFIQNDDVNGMKVPEYLDKQFYIDIANKRLQQFGL